MQYRIPIFRPPALDLRLLHKYLEPSILAGRYSNWGPAEQLLEQRLCDHFGLRAGQLTLLSNATLALEAALTTRSQPGEEWVLPSWSFAATGLAALRSGVTFSFGDVGIRDGVLIPVRGSDRIMGVAPFGASPIGPSFHQMDIVDAAASFDAMEGQGPNLALNAGYVVSLHATKTLASGEGGVFISKDMEWVQKVKSFANFGFANGVRSSMQVGTNAKMSEVTAAFGLASLDAWQNGLRDRWRDVARKAKSISSSAGFDSFFAVEEGYGSPYWILKLDSSADRKNLIREMAQSAIETRDWWGEGMHVMKPFLGINRGYLENTLSWVSTSVALPLYPSMNASDFKSIQGVLERVS